MYAEGEAAFNQGREDVSGLRCFQGGMEEGASRRLLCASLSDLKSVIMEAT